MMHGVAGKAFSAMQIGHELLTAAGRANTTNTSIVSVAERRTWFSNAARMFYNSPDGVAIAARWLLTSVHPMYTLHPKQFTDSA